MGEDKEDAIYSWPRGNMGHVSRMMATWKYGTRQQNDVLGEWG